MKVTAGSPLQILLDTLPQKGEVIWIGIRLSRKEALLPIPFVEAISNKKLKGDHYTGGSKRQVTLIQQEHIDAIKSIMRLSDLSPSTLRRNIVVRGLNLLSLKNKVQLIGFLGKDAEIKRFDSGKVMATISLATSENYKNGSGKKVTDTQWHNLIAWGKTAEFIEKYTTKGSEIGIEGKLMNRTYEDKNGVKRYVTEVSITDVLLMNAKKAEQEAA